MDVAYDHITEETLPDTANENKPTEAGDEGLRQKADLNTEFQEAFTAISASPWGAKLGGWFSHARKQGESFYQDLQKEASEASEHATKGFESLREQVVSRTRGMTLNATADEEREKSEQDVPTIETSAPPPDMLPPEIVNQAGNLVASLRSTAAARLKDLQRAEDAADEALLRFGTNVRNFLRDAVTITAPDDEEGGKKEVLFETQEPGTGRKVFHSTRLDAQLHAIHTNSGSFAEDPQGEEWIAWEEDFDVEKKTDAITGDLEQYEELRRAMEKLVPEKVEYKAFWMRYYFLRKAIEEEEKRRKEVLKGAAADHEEEIGWDDEDEEEPSTTPQPHAKASESTTTLNAPETVVAIQTGTADLLKPKEPRRSEDEKRSVAGSDASYDMISGSVSRAHGSPKGQDDKHSKDEESDDDWE